MSAVALKIIRGNAKDYCHRINVLRAVKGTHMIIAMNGLKHALGACLLTSALLASVAAQAATYYVATTGNNSNPGTSSEPWRTVAYAVSQMVAGDTTYVKDGTYNEGSISFRKSGTSTQPIKLLAYPGHAPKIHFIKGLLQGLQLAENSDRIAIFNPTNYKLPIGWITIEGFELENGREGIKIYTGHDITIRRNYIHNNGHGVLGNGTRVLFDRNRFIHNGQFDYCDQGYASACNGDHGIYFNGSNVTVTNNIFSDNLTSGIQVNGTGRYDSSIHAGPEYVEVNNWVIANNTFAYTSHSSGLILWSRIRNVRVENNIFYENRQKNNGGQAISFAAGFVTHKSSGNQIRNNLAYATAPGGTAFFNNPGGAVEGVEYTQSGNVVNVRNPGFVNAPSTVPASSNFALTERSPAIDGGLPLTEITTTSFDGTPRPQGRAYDIGAYEYKAGGDTQPPIAVIGLQVR